MNFLSREDLLSKFQFGYWPRQFTTQAAILFIDDIQKEVHKGNLVGAVFTVVYFPGQETGAIERALAQDL